MSLNHFQKDNVSVYCQCFSLLAVFQSIASVSFYASVSVYWQCFSLLTVFQSIGGVSVYWQCFSLLADTPVTQ